MREVAPVASTEIPLLLSGTTGLRMRRFSADANVTTSFHVPGGAKFLLVAISSGNKQLWLCNATNSGGVTASPLNTASTAYTVATSANVIAITQSGTGSPQYAFLIIYGETEEFYKIT